MDMSEVAQMAREALDSSKSAHHRLNTLESEVKDIRGLTAAMAAVNQKVDGLQSTVGEIKKDVKAITARPRKWWDTLVEILMSAVVGGAVTLMFVHIFH